MSISKKSRTKIKNTGTFLVFAGPSLFFFVMTILVPLVYGVYLTFTDWNGISREKNIVGLENYIKAFGDVKFWQSLLLTIIFTGIAVLLVNYIAFHLARLVTKGVRFQNFYRASFFTPKSDRRSCPGVYLAVYFWKGVGGFWQIPGYWIPFKVLAV